MFSFTDKFKHFSKYQGLIIGNMPCREIKTNRVIIFFYHFHNDLGHGLPKGISLSFNSVNPPTINPARFFNLPARSSVRIIRSMEYKIFAYIFNK